MVPDAELLAADAVAKLHAIAFWLHQQNRDDLADQATHAATIAAVVERDLHKAG